MLVTRATVCLFTHLLLLFIGYLLAKEFQRKQDRRPLLMRKSNLLPKEEKASCHMVKIPCQEKGDKNSIEKEERENRCLCFYICASKNITYVFIHICGNRSKYPEEWDKEIYFIRERNYFKINGTSFTSCKNELITPSLLEKDFFQLRTFVSLKVPSPLITRRNYVLRALLKDLYRYQKQFIDNEMISAKCFKIEDDIFIVSSNTKTVSYFFESCCCYNEVKKSSNLKKKLPFVNSKIYGKIVLDEKALPSDGALNEKSNSRMFVDENVFHRHSVDKHLENFLKYENKHSRSENQKKPTSGFEKYLKTNEFQNKMFNYFKNQDENLDRLHQNKDIDIALNERNIPGINERNVVQSDKIKFSSSNYLKNFRVFKSSFPTLPSERKKMFLSRAPHRKLPFNVKDANTHISNNLSNSTSFGYSAFNIINLIRLTSPVKGAEKSSASEKHRVSKHLTASSNTDFRNIFKRSPSFKFLPNTLNTKDINSNTSNHERVTSHLEPREILRTKNSFLENFDHVHRSGMKPKKSTSHVYGNSVPKSLFDKESEKIPQSERYFHFASKLLKSRAELKNLKIPNEDDDLSNLKSYSYFSEGKIKKRSIDKRDLTNSESVKSKLADGNDFSTAKKIQFLQLSSENIFEFDKNTKNSIHINGFQAESNSLPSESNLKKPLPDTELPHPKYWNIFDKRNKNILLTKPIKNVKLVNKAVFSTDKASKDTTNNSLESSRHIEHLSAEKMLVKPTNQFSDHLNDNSSELLKNSQMTDRSANNYNGTSLSPNPRNMQSEVPSKKDGKEGLSENTDKIKAKSDTFNNTNVLEKLFIDVDPVDEELTPFFNMQEQVTKNEISDKIGIISDEQVINKHNAGVIFNDTEQTLSDTENEEFLQKKIVPDLMNKDEFSTDNEVHINITFLNKSSTFLTDQVTQTIKTTQKVSYEVYNSNETSKQPSINTKLKVKDYFDGIQTNVTLEEHNKKANKYSESKSLQFNPFIKEDSSSTLHTTTENFNDDATVKSLDNAKFSSTFTTKMLSGTSGLYRSSTIFLPSIPDLRATKAPVVDNPVSFQSKRNYSVTETKTSSSTPRSILNRNKTLDITSKGSEKTHSTKENSHSLENTFASTKSFPDSVTENKTEISNFSTLGKEFDNTVDYSNNDDSEAKAVKVNDEKDYIMNYTTRKDISGMITAIHTDNLMNLTKNNISLKNDSYVNNTLLYGNTTTKTEVTANINEKSQVQSEGYPSLQELDNKENGTSELESEIFVTYVTKDVSDMKDRKNNIPEEDAEATEDKTKTPSIANSPFADVNVHQKENHMIPVDNISLFTESDILSDKKSNLPVYETNSTFLDDITTELETDRSFSRENDVQTQNNTDPDIASYKILIRTDRDVLPFKDREQSVDAEDSENIFSVKNELQTNAETEMPVSHISFNFKIPDTTTAKYEVTKYDQEHSQVFSDSFQPTQDLTDEDGDMFKNKFLVKRVTEDLLDKTDSNRYTSDEGFEYMTDKTRTFISTFFPPSDRTRHLKENTVILAQSDFPLNTESSHFAGEISNTFVDDLTAESQTDRSPSIGNDMQTQNNKDIDFSSDEILIRTDRDLSLKDGSFSINVEDFENTFSVDNDVKTNTKPDVTVSSMSNGFKIPAAEQNFPIKDIEKNTFTNGEIVSEIYIKPSSDRTESEYSVVKEITYFEDEISNTFVDDITTESQTDRSLFVRNDLQTQNNKDFDISSDQVLIRTDRDLSLKDGSLSDDVGDFENNFSVDNEIKTNTKPDITASSMSYDFKIPTDEKTFTVKDINKNTFINRGIGSEIYIKPSDDRTESEYSVVKEIAPSTDYEVNFSTKRGLYFTDYSNGFSESNSEITHSVFSEENSDLFSTGKKSISSVDNKYTIDDLSTKGNGEADMNYENSKTVNDFIYNDKEITSSTVRDKMSSDDLFLHKIPEKDYVDDIPTYKNADYSTDLRVLSSSEISKLFSSGTEVSENDMIDTESHYDNGINEIFRTERELTSLNEEAKTFSDEATLTEYKNKDITLPNENFRTEQLLPFSTEGRQFSSENGLADGSEKVTQDLEFTEIMNEHSLNDNSENAITNRFIETFSDSVFTEKVALSTEALKKFPVSTSTTNNDVKDLNNKAIKSQVENISTYNPIMLLTEDINISPDDISFNQNTETSRETETTKTLTVAISTEQQKTSFRERVDIPTTLISATKEIQTTLDDKTNEQSDENILPELPTQILTEKDISSSTDFSFGVDTKTYQNEETTESEDDLIRTEREVWSTSRRNELTLDGITSAKNFSTNQEEEATESVNETFDTEQNMPLSTKNTNSFSVDIVKEKNNKKDTEEIVTEKALKGTSSEWPAISSTEKGSDIFSVEDTVVAMTETNLMDKEAGSVGIVTESETSPANKLTSFSVLSEEPYSETGPLDEVTGTGSLSVLSTDNELTSFSMFTEKDDSEDENEKTTFPVNELIRTERQILSSNQDSPDSPSNPTEKVIDVTKNVPLPTTLNTKLPSESELDSESREISPETVSDRSISDNVEKSTKNNIEAIFENKSTSVDNNFKLTTIAEKSFNVDSQEDSSKKLKPYTNLESSTTQLSITKNDAEEVSLITSKREISFSPKTSSSPVTKSTEMGETNDKTTVESTREKDVSKSPTIASSDISFTDSMDSSKKVMSSASEQSYESSTKQLSVSNSPSLSTTKTTSTTSSSSSTTTTTTTTLKPSTNTFNSSEDKKSSVTTTIISTSDYPSIPFHFTIDADYDKVVGKRKKEFEENLTNQLIVVMRIPHECLQNLLVSKGSIDVNFELAPNSKYGHMADEKALKAAADELKRRIDNGQLNIKDLDGNTLVVVPMDPPTKTPVVNQTEHTTIILAVVIGAFILTVISVAIAAIIIKRKANDVHRLTPIEEVRSKLPSYREIPFQEALFMRGPTKNKLMLGKYCYNTGKWLGPGPEPVPYHPPDSVVYRPPTDSEIRQTPRPSTAVRERLRNDWELDWDSMVFSR